MSQAPAEVQDVRLVPVTLDLSTKTVQLVLATALAIVTTLAAALPSLRLGLIANDFAVLNAVAGASQGGMAGFFLTLSNQSLSALSLGPFALLLMLMNFLCIHVDSISWHAENILLYTFCVLLVGHICAALSYRSGSRLAPGALVWAALLYAIFPSHIGAMSWVSAQPDLLCATLCLSSIFCYLRFRILRERAYFTLSLVAFTVALLTKIEALTIPAVIGSLELLIFQGDKTPALRRALFVGAFFMVLLFLSTAALVFPLPLSTINSTLISTLSTFTNFSTWQSLLLMTSFNTGLFTQLFSENSSSSLYQLIIAAYVGALIIAGARLVKASMNPAVLAWLGLWLVLSLVSDPGLTVGPAPEGRLLFFASAPLCIGITIMCLPSIDSLGAQSARRLSILGTIPLLALFGTFLCLMQQQNSSWQTAATQTKSVTEAAIEISRKLGPGQGLLITELPPSISSDWVRFAFQEPFHDLGRMVESAPPGVLENNAVWPLQLTAALKGINCGAILRWNTESGPIRGWSAPTGTSQVFAQFNQTTIHQLAIGPEPDAQAKAPLPESVSVDRAKEQQIAATPNSIAIHPRFKPVTIWLPETRVNPEKLDVAELNLTLTEGPGCRSCQSGKVEILWSATSIDGSKQQTGRAYISYLSDGKYLVWLGRYPNWTLSKTIRRIGLKFQPGNYYARLASLRLLQHSVAIPELSINASEQTRLEPLKLPAAEGAKLRFDVSQIPSACGARILIWSDGADFSPHSEAALYTLSPDNGARTIFHSDFMIKRDVATLSPDLFVLPGTYFARAVALSKDHAIIGLPTEPLAFSFKRTPP